MMVFRRFPLHLSAAVLLGLAGGGTGALAQSQSPAAPTLSLQSQLGSISLAPPRALVKPQMLRTVRLTQVTPQGEVVGVPHEISCPGSGCQQLIALSVDNVARSFLVDVQFVGNGAYVTLELRSIAVAGVVEFSRGRPGPIFVRGDAKSTIEQRLRLVAVPPGSVRAMETASNPRTFASGNVYTRKVAPDMLLKVEIGPEKPTG